MRLTYYMFVFLSQFWNDLGVSVLCNMNTLRWQQTRHCRVKHLLQWAICERVWQKQRTSSTEQKYSHSFTSLNHVCVHSPFAFIASTDSSEVLNCDVAAQIIFCVTSFPWGLSQDKEFVLCTAANPFIKKHNINPPGGGGGGEMDHKRRSCCIILCLWCNQAALLYHLYNFKPSISKWKKIYLLSIWITYY